ncbi:hypothetical protein THRCLA_22738 [Thraustotheca clavata]|uniref:Uncharacterized protein n=1 Tax=Thraustotheca clavata TaxID=74557 RepID=A0A1V9YU00_9STRA|nr:hypothetical protein THRCLA_22738 [Thraustotheca clavata]
MSDRRLPQASAVDPQALQDELTQAYRSVADAKLKRKIAEEKWRKADLGCLQCSTLQEQLDAANRQIAELKKALEFECSSHFISAENEQTEQSTPSRQTSSARYSSGTIQAPRSCTPQETIMQVHLPPVNANGVETKQTNPRKRKKKSQETHQDDVPQTQATEATAIPPLSAFPKDNGGETPAQNPWLSKLFALSAANAKMQETQSSLMVLSKTTLQEAQNSTIAPSKATIQEAQSSFTAPSETLQEAQNSTMVPSETLRESSDQMVPESPNEDSGENPILKTLKKTSRKKNAPREYFSGGQRRWKCTKVLGSGPDGDILCDRRAVSFAVGLCTLHRK